MDASGANAKPTWPLDVGSPKGSVLEVNGGLGWPPLLLLHNSRAAHAIRPEGVGPRSPGGPGGSLPRAVPLGVGRFMQ